MKTQNNQDHDFDPLASDWGFEGCDDELRPGQENWLVVCWWSAEADARKLIFSFEKIPDMVQRACGRNSASLITYYDQSASVVIVNPDNENAIAMAIDLLRKIDGGICLDEEGWREEIADQVHDQWDGESLLERMRYLPASANFADVLKKHCPASAWPEIARCFDDP